jgi:uncharacterized membrane protein YkoI
LAVAGIQACADKVPLAQVPQAVQKAISEQSKGEAVQDIERETRDGQTVYQAEFKREGLNRHVTFAADGSIIPERRGFADVGTSPALNTLPAAVQKTVEEQRAGRVVGDIDKEMWNGQTVYEVEFKEKGKNSRIHIANDGSMVMNKGARGSYLGTQLSETPKAVQDTVKGLAGNAEVADVDVKTKDGKVVYDVEVQQEGLNRRLQIAENGALLSDNKGGGGTIDALRERVRETVDRDARTMKYDEVPTAVQATIKANGDVANLKSIKQEVKDGTVNYDVEFERDGKNTRLKIGQNGGLLEDNRK